MSSPLARRLADQASQCGRLGSALYADLLTHAAADLTAGGPTAEVLAGHEPDPAGSALALRFMAALHRQVLTGNAPLLAAHYPSAGGRAGLAGAWPAARRTLQTRGQQIAADLELPCQTNEPGRAAGLLVGLLHIARRHPGCRVRLLEFGASAGLNLHVDRYRIGTYGPAGVPPLLDRPWVGGRPAPAPFQIADRAGCDLSPLDPGTEAGQLALRASIWADQMHRFERLRVALRVAAAHPVAVQPAGAAEWLGQRLAVPTPGQVTVVWHSVVWQYLGAAGRTAVAEVLGDAGRRATPDAPLVRVSLEPELHGRGRVRFAVRATSWPGGDRLHLADAQGHGPPVRLRP